MASAAACLGSSALIQGGLTGQKLSLATPTSLTCSRYPIFHHILIQPLFVIREFRVLVLNFDAILLILRTWILGIHRHDYLFLFANTGCYVSRKFSGCFVVTQLVASVS